MKKKKQVNPYDLGGLMQGAGSIAGLIPGGQLIGTGLNVIGSLISGNKQKKEEKAAQDRQLLMQKQEQIANRPESSGGMIQGLANPYMLALGGLTAGNEKDFLNAYETGGLHEQNPNGGIPIGTGSNGKMNTVEEGESSFGFADGKYIFSNRLNVEGTSDIGLPASVDNKSYADASKSIESLFNGRNSKIDLDTKKNLMRRLRNSQETKKQVIQEQFANGGLSRTSDYGSSKNPYPAVASGDFAGGNRSYPIPTKNDAIDALRLAGLHGRGDIKSKVYSKYPELQKNAYGGIINTYQEGGIDPVISQPQSYAAQDAQDLASMGSDYTDTSATIDSGPSWWSKNKGMLGTVGSFGLMAAPIIGNEISRRNLQQPESIQTQTIDTEIQPQLVNRQQLQRNLVGQLAGSRQALAEHSTGDFGQYAANLQSLHAGSSQALGNVTLQANLADAQERARAEQANIGIEQFNIGQEMRGGEINAQNQAAYEAQKAAYDQARMQNLANIGKTAWNYKQSQGYTKAMSNVMSLLGLQQKTE